MNRRIRKIVSLIVCLSLVCSVQVCSKKQAAKAYTAHTADEAIAWAASKVGQSLEGDNYYGNNNSCAYQCVDFIICYYKYLGVSPSSGNGCDYATNTLPAGWTRVKGGTPQKGDILVYSGNASNPYGHVAIYESDRSTYHQNISNCRKVTHETYRYNGFSNPYWGYIRPDWNGSVNNASYSNLHTTFVDGWNAGLYGKINNPSKLKVSEVGVWVWDSAGTLVVNHKEACGLSTSYVNQELNIVGEALPTGLKSGETYKYQMYAVVGGTTIKSSVESFTTVDDQKPVISNVQVSDISSSGYTVSCTVTDNHKVARVQFPTWTEKNGQDDIQADWTTASKASGTKNGDVYTYRVNISDHNNESGVYHTHIYAFDTSGNSSFTPAQDVTVPEKVIATPTPTATHTPEVTLQPSTPTPTVNDAADTPTSSVSTATPQITPKPNNVEDSDFTKFTASNLKNTSVTITATIPSQYVKSWGYYWGSNSSALKKSSERTTERNISTFLVKFTNLTPNTTYYYYFYYKTSSGTKVSKLWKFTTLKTADSETTATVTAPAKVTISSLYSGAKKKLTVSWKRLADVDGYQVQYSLYKNFTTYKTTTAGSLTVSKTVGSLTSKKKYYVRVRAYRNSNGKKLYGSWSAVKNCRVK